MKFATMSKILVVGLALTLVSSAFAASKANLTLNNPTSINGTKLKAGDYKLEWDGSGPNVEVSILQGKNVVATTSAKVVDSTQGFDSVTFGTAGNTKTLEEIDFGGQHKALVFSSQETAKN